MADTRWNEEFCDEILWVKNFVSAFSLEGSEEANDSRRGKGNYQSPEDVDSLCDKTTPYANAWKGTAQELWAADPKSINYPPRKR